MNHFYTSNYYELKMMNTDASPRRLNYFTIAENGAQQS